MESHFGKAKWSQMARTTVNPQVLCKRCGSSVTLNYATAYYGLESDQFISEMVVRALAEGKSIRAPGCILQINKDTVCDWLNRAALHSCLEILYLWHQLHVTECQLDELWGFVHTKEDHLLRNEAVQSFFLDSLTAREDRAVLSNAQAEGEVAQGLAAFNQGPVGGVQAGRAGSEHVDDDAHSLARLDGLRQVVTIGPRVQL